MSEKDIRITADPETIVDAEESSLPNNILAVGEISTDDVKVYIKQDVYHAIEKRSASNMTIELGNILLGKVAEVFGKRHVIITACIEAKYTDASSSTLTFTHETWDYVNKIHEEKYSGLRIVGWQHTHPGYGIFLSNYDMFIQENFFNLPFQIAYVVDPKQKIRGFFQWQNEKVERLKGFYLFGSVLKFSTVC
ncbi:hypothetical protein AGMMS49983_11210 [Clostridia bacterium]|nr:hypothetical protein AGMMS49983_11210 [Clostridia bacterium]